MINKMPDGLVKYGETKLFTHATVPANLTSAHNTKPGVWGKLVVKTGMLVYVISGPPEERRTLCQGEYGVIEPTVPHYVEPKDDASFCVEFYRANDA